MAELTRRDVLKLAAVGAAAAVPGSRARRRPDHAEARAVVAQGRRHCVPRSPPEHVIERHPHLVHIFDNLTSRRPDGKARTRPRRGVEAPGADDVGIQAAPGVKWHNGDPVHVGRRDSSGIDRTLDTTLKGTV